MKISIVLNDQNFTFDASKVLDISIPLKFNEEQPNTYNINRAVSKAYLTDGFIGDTRQGGACNFEQITLVPHCNGTHTECIGHITHNRYSVQNQLKESLIPATLVSVIPEKALNSKDQYSPEKEDRDVFISSKILKKALASATKEFLKALIIRTLPNEASKKTRDYMKQEPPFISMDAMRYIVSLGVEHLLIDLPSVDRLFDDGELNAHHIFWNMKPGGHGVEEDSKINRTITEMIYVDDQISDGSYLLNLQIAPFVSDASPSRPLLFPLIKAGHQKKE